ncbi:MAG TPA: class I SAM-dependent methyltransferase [Gemmatimonadaceae bacterium]|nr:class I SAM-dependent methyltransferase [Gemmatimonadaceae bacterium]
MSATPRVPPVPAVLRLVQMAVLGRWRATGEDLYREVARVTEAAPKKEIVVSGCGDGVTAEWLALRTAASVTGVDPDLDAIEGAETRARALTTAPQLHYQSAPLDDLPYETAVFDIAIGEPALSSSTDPARAVGELVRVTKPMGPVVLLQPTWSSDISMGARELLIERLGLRPFLLVEWKQMLRDAGVVDVQVQDWTTGSASGARWTGASAAQAPVLNWRQKMQILGRAWRVWGWREARSAVERETTLLRELSRERAIGFQLIKGVKWPHARSA